MLTALFLLASSAGANSCKESHSLAGKWTVFENVSGKNYELSFEDSGALQQRVGKETDVGNYYLDCFGNA